TQGDYPDKNKGNAQFTVQPWDQNKWNNITRYLTAWLSWSSGWWRGVLYQYVSFGLYDGDYSRGEIENHNAFAVWPVPSKNTFKGDGGAQRFHINLYLAEGTPPEEEQRVTITRFQRWNGLGTQHRLAFPSS